MSFEINSGSPFVTIKQPGDDTPVVFPSTTLSLYVGGAAGTKIYFSSKDLAADTNHITITSQGFWQGQVACKGVYVSGSGPVEVAGFCFSR